MATTRAQLSHRKTAGPIVSVYDVGLESQMLEQCERGAREESETNVVVTEAVDCRTCEELRCVEQVSRRARGIAEQKANLVNFAAPLDAHVLNGAAIQQRAINLLVKRKDELRIDIEILQRFRQSTGDV